MDDILKSKRQELLEGLSVEIRDVGFKKFEKQCQSLAEEISEYALDNVKENLATWITDHVRQQATAVVEALLAGDMRTVRYYLKIEDECGREDYGRREWMDRPWFKYSSSLHEFGGVELRHKIVDEHKDLIANERIKDLELQLAGLCKRYGYHDHVGGELAQMRLRAEKAEAEVDRLNSLTHDHYKILSGDE